MLLKTKIQIKKPHIDKLKINSWGQIQVGEN
jgi:hypothetical protein